MKVLVLSGRFGMGHEMAANAICEEFQKIDKDAKIIKKHLSKLIFGGFRLMVEHCHGIYNFIYKMSGKMKVEVRPRGEAIYRKLRELLENEAPDVIVCTHPMCVKAIASYKEKTGLKTPLITSRVDSFADGYLSCANTGNQRTSGSKRNQIRKYTGDRNPGKTTIYEEKSRYGRRKPECT